MPVRVHVGGWEHECCGGAVERGDRVVWTCIVTADGSLLETHHELHGPKMAHVEGTVVDIEMIMSGGTRQSIQRLPSGDALTGSDEESEIRAHDSGQVLEPSTTDFLVTLIPSH